MIFTLVFWKAAAERAIKTAAQAVALFAAADGFDWLQMDAKRFASVVIAAAVSSVLTSIVSAPFGPAGSPSLVVDDENAVHPDAA